MSKMRQIALLDPRRQPRAAITTLTYSYSDGHSVPEHFHEEDQVLYGVSGVMAVTSAEGIWVVPPNRAVWIPAKTAHSIVMWGPLTMKTLYLRPKLVKRLARQCCMVNVSPLLKELIFEACKLRSLYRTRPIQGRLVGVILDQLEESSQVPLHMPMPRDTRALRIADLCMRGPSTRRPLADLCRECGASKRTIERLFREETGVSFGRWRQQLGLARSIHMLASGNKVTSVALEAGYKSPSAFIAMFRKYLGATPTQYLASQVEGECTCGIRAAFG